MSAKSRRRTPHPADRAAADQLRAEIRERYGDDDTVIVYLTRAQPGRVCGWCDCATRRPPDGRCAGCDAPATTTMHLIHTEHVSWDLCQRHADSAPVHVVRRLDTAIAAWRDVTNPN